MGSQRQKVLTLRYMGYSFADISEICGISESQVKYHVDQAILASVDQDRIAVLREAEMGKLEALEEAYMPFALGGAETNDGETALPDHDSAKMVLSVMDRRSKLLGVDKSQPLQVVHTHSLVGILAKMAQQEPIETIPYREAAE